MMNQNHALHCTFVTKLWNKKAHKWYYVNKWHARATVQGKQTHLGYHKTFLEGHRAAKTFKQVEFERICQEYLKGVKCDAETLLKYFTTDGCP